MTADPYTLIAVLFCIVAALLIALCFVFEKLCQLEDRTMRLTRDTEARFWELEEDLKRIRQKEAMRRMRDKRWSERSHELCLVDENGVEVSARRSS